MENTIRKRNADAVKTAKFLCIMAASGIGLFRLFFFGFNAEYKTFNYIFQRYFSSSKPVLSGAEAKREGNELGEIGYSFRGEIKTHVQVANLNPRRKLNCLFRVPKRFFLKSIFHRSCVFLSVQSFD